MILHDRTRLTVCFRIFFFNAQRFSNRSRIMKKQVSGKQLSRFYSSLATFLKSGLTVERGLDTMKEGKQGPVLWMMDGLQYHIGRGGALWQGMSHYPKYFDEFQVMIVKGAEESGMLAPTFKKLAQYYESRYVAKRRFLAGLIYPITLLHAVVLLPPLKYLLVENLNRSYASVVLPPLLGAYGIIGLVTILWKKYLRTGLLRRKVDGFVLDLPALGILVRDVSLARAFWSLSAMLTAGVDAISAARNAAAAANNTVIKQQLNDTLYVLEIGRSFKEYYAATGMISSDQLGVVSVGEDSGALAESLEQMVHQMEDTNAHRFEMLMKGVGMLIYFIVAAIVAFTVLSFYMNYFKI